MRAPLTKEKIRKYAGLNDMGEKLALSDDRVVHMSEKFDGHYVTILHDGQTIRIVSAGGHFLKYCLGLEAMPSLPPDVELRAELVLEKDTAKSSYEQFLDTNAMFSRAQLAPNAANPYLDLRDLREWDECDEHTVPCKILLHVHGLVDHGHDLNTELVAQYLEGAHPNIRQIPWTLVSSVQQAKQRLQAMFEANKEGLMFFVQKLAPAPSALGSGKSAADSRSCSPEPASQTPRTVVGSEWIKGKLRFSYNGRVVRTQREQGRWMYTVRLENCPPPVAEVRVRLGNTRGFDGQDNVCVDVIPNSFSDQKARHAIGMGVEAASGKRKRE